MKRSASCKEPSKTQGLTQAKRSGDVSVPGFCAPSPKNHNSKVVALLLFVFILFSANIGGYDLWPADEPRFAEVAREMLDSGDYLAPHVNGQPYREKPPLLFWSIAAISIPFGDVTEFSARFPSALAALLTAAITYLLARRMYGPRVATLAVIVLATSMRFWWQARNVQIDMLLTVCLTFGLYALREWDQNRRTAWLVAFYAAMAAGLYAKGPPVLVFMLCAIFAMYWKSPAERRKMHWVIGTVISICAVLLWLIPARMSVAEVGGDVASGAIATNMFRQIIGRALLGVSKAQWPWYYLQTLPVDLFPWTLFLPWTLIWAWKNRRDGRDMRLLLSWTLPAFILFSIFVGKRALYLLPLFPAISILIARSISVLIDQGHEKWQDRTRKAWGMILLVAGLASVTAYWTEYRDTYMEGGIVLSVVMVMCGIVAILSNPQKVTDGLPKMIAWQMCALLLVVSFIVFPAVNSHRSARAICTPVSELSIAKADFRLYSVGFSREEYIFYSRAFHEPVLTGLIETSMDAQIDFIDMAKAQKRARKTIVKAVSKVPVHAIGNITAEERVKLMEALEAALEDTDMPEGLADAIELGLEDYVARFAEEFAAPGQAFMFVQKRDWLWLVTLCPELNDNEVLLNRSVGRRDVLLISNARAAV